MSAGGPLLSVKSGIVSAKGSIDAGEGQAKAYEFNAQVAEQNAIQAQLISAQQERQSRINSRRQLGEMRTGYGASGVNMEGSPMAVLAESAAAAEMDALNIKYGGESKAMNFRNEASLNRYAAGQARSAGYMGAASSLLSSYASASKMMPTGGSA